mgnify:CR=1 FL=1
MDRTSWKPKVFKATESVDYKEADENWKDVANKIYKEELNKDKKSAGEANSMYGYGSATGKMSPVEAWNQGADVYGDMGYDQSLRNPIFDEFRGLQWSELPTDIQETWKSELDYMTGESKASEGHIWGSWFDDNFKEVYTMDQDGTYRCKHCDAWFDMNGEYGSHSPQVVAQYHLKQEHNIGESKASEDIIDNYADSSATHVNEDGSLGDLDKQFDNDEYEPSDESKSTEGFNQGLYGYVDAKCKTCGIEFDSISDMDDHYAMNSDHISNLDDLDNDIPNSD